MVPLAGLEPAWFAPTDFKSATSTDFVTAAKHEKNGNRERAERRGPTDNAGRRYRFFVKRRQRTPIFLISFYHKVPAVSIAAAQSAAKEGVALQ